MTELIREIRFYGRSVSFYDICHRLNAMDIGPDSVWNQGRFVIVA